MKPNDAPDNPQPSSQRPDVDDDGLIRLQKLLAQSGVASRRKCEELMLDGLVEVDGEVVTGAGQVSEYVFPWNLMELTTVEPSSVQ